MAEQYIRVRLVKSNIGVSKRQRATVEALGLRKLGQEKIHKATEAVLGMCRKVSHLVTWEEVDPGELPADEVQAK